MIDGVGIQTIFFGIIKGYDLWTLDLKIFLMLNLLYKVHTYKYYRKLLKNNENQELVFILKLFIFKKRSTHIDESSSMIIFHFNWSNSFQLAIFTSRIKNE